MDKLDVLIWAMSGGFAGTWMLIFYVLARIGKLDDKITAVDRDVCHIKGALMNKECCMLQHDYKERVQ